jgi:hypothetical protein
MSSKSFSSWSFVICLYSTELELSLLSLFVGLLEADSSTAVALLFFEAEDPSSFLLI